MKKRTTNQLGLAPMRIPNTRASWIEPAPTPTWSHARPTPRGGCGPAADHGSALADDRAVDDEARRRERAAVRRGHRAVAGEVLDRVDLGLAGRGDTGGPG